jgi:hypothetical protein
MSRRTVFVGGDAIKRLGGGVLERSYRQWEMNK